MKLTLTLTFAVIVFGMTLGAAAQRGNAAEALLGAGLHQQDAEDDCKEAIKLFERAIKEKGAPRTVAARAQLHIGMCLERLGQREARSAYERVLSTYGDQPEAVAQARTRLTALAPPITKQPTVTASGPMRVFSAGPPSVSWRGITSDGRFVLSAQGIYDPRTGTGRPIDWAHTNGGRGMGVGPWPAAGTCRGGYPQVDRAAVSADGKQIAYTCDDSRSPRLDAFQLRVLPLNAEKGVSARVLLAGDDVSRVFPFGWSPDGRTVFMSLRRNDDSFEIASVPVAGGPRRVVKRLEWWQYPEYLSLSPDGKSIAYDRPIERDSRDRDIFVVASDGSQENHIVQNPARDSLAVWTPAGDALVFSSNRTGLVGMWTVAIRDGKRLGAETAIRQRTRDYWPLGFGHDGSFYYAHSSDRLQEIRTADVDLESGRVLRQPSALGVRASAYNASPAYSPDGRTLAYLSSEASHSPFFTIVLRSLDSGAEREVPTPLIDAFSPQWFPDGRSILLIGLANAGSRLSIHRIDTQTGKNLMDRVVRADSSLRVSPDGRMFYFVRRISKTDRALITYDLETARETTLTTTRDAIGEIRLSPDGQRIAFERRNQSGLTDLVVLPGSGGSATPIRVDGNMPSLIRWSTNGRELVVWRITGNSLNDGEIWLVPVDGSAARKVGSDPVPRPQAAQSSGNQTAFIEALPGTYVLPEVWVDRALVAPASGRR